MERNKIKELAISYFEGRISFEDEATLFEFISMNEEYSKMFRNWEKDWMLKLNEENNIHSEWNSLQAKIGTRKVIAPLFQPRRNILSIYRKIAVVAAIIVITVISTLLINNATLLNSSERTFVVETPNGEKSRITLPDGSIVWINSTSIISYNAEFGEKDRTVILDGEAYFEVNKKDDLPFTVKTRGYDIVVRGTKFNVSSYAEDMKITTTLMEGIVEVVRDDEVLFLNPGESLELDTKDYKFSKEKVNSNQYKSWVDNKIEYDGIPLHELLNRLSRQYDVKIHLETDMLKSRYLNISLKNNESIEEILHGLSLAIPMNIEYKGQDIYIKLK